MENRRKWLISRISSEEKDDKSPALPEFAAQYWQLMSRTWPQAHWTRMEVTTSPLRWRVTVGLAAQLPGAAGALPGEGSGLKVPATETALGAPPEASAAGVSGVKT
jgi:hypothetical protein